MSFFIMVIYCIENIKNHKCYIGQTTQTLSRRKAQHKAHLNTDIHSNSRLQSDWDEHGSESFRFFKLEQAQDVDGLNNREIEWIKVLDTTNDKYGYNIDKGGSSVDPSRYASLSYVQPVVKYGLDGTLIKKYDSIAQAVEEHDGSPQNIISCLNGNTDTAYDFQWERYYGNLKKQIEPTKSRIEKKRNKGESKVTKQYSLSGKLIDTFASASEAGRQTGCNPTSIRFACKGRYNTSGGYQWRYEGSDREVEDLSDYTPPSNEKIPVVKKDEEGNIVKKWESIGDCAKDLGMSTTGIKHRCKNNSFHFWYFNKD